MSEPSDKPQKPETSGKQRKRAEAKRSVKEAVELGEQLAVVLDVIDNEQTRRPGGARRRRDLPECGTEARHGTPLVCEFEAVGGDPQYGVVIADAVYEDGHNPEAHWYTYPPHADRIIARMDVAE